MSEALPKCLVLAGPTASGKTEASLARFWRAVTARSLSAWEEMVDAAGIEPATPTMST